MKTKKSSETNEHKKPFFRRRKVRILLMVVAVLIVCRIILPYVLLHYANKRLANMPGYYGHVDDLDLSLYRGAYKLKNLYLDKLDSVTKVRTKFFNVQLVDLSLEWAALFHGRLVGKVDMEYPSLRITKDKTDPSKVAQDTSNFRTLFKSFMPLKVNRLAVNHGEIHYIDEGSVPKVDIFMTETHALADNLSNVADSSKLPSIIHAGAYMSGGIMNFDMRLNPLAADPLFEMKAKLENANLATFNDFFLAYGKFDVNSGNFGLYTEFSAADGKFIGYVKPVIKDLKVIGPKDKHDSFFHLMWEEIVGAAGMILKNHPKDQIATKIPIEGSFKMVDKIDTWGAIAILLRNAFIQALIPSIDNEISLNSIYNPPQDEKKKGFFKKLFGTKKTNGN
jgi:hypothetical protein